MFSFSLYKAPELLQIWMQDIGNKAACRFPGTRLQSILGQGSLSSICWPNGGSSMSRSIFVNLKEKSHSSLCLYPSWPELRAHIAAASLSTCMVTCMCLFNHLSLKNGAVVFMMHLGRWFQMNLQYCTRWSHESPIKKITFQKSYEEACGLSCMYLNLIDQLQITNVISMLKFYFFCVSKMFLKKI